MLVSPASALEKRLFARPPNNVKISEACPLNRIPSLIARAKTPFATRNHEFAVCSRSFRCSRPSDSQSAAARFAVRTRCDSQCSRSSRCSQPFGSHSSRLVRSWQPFGTRSHSGPTKVLGQGHDDHRRALVLTKPSPIARAPIRLHGEAPLGPPSNAATTGGVCLLSGEVATSPSHPFFPLLTQLR